MRRCAFALLVAVATTLAVLPGRVEAQGGSETITRMRAMLRELDIKVPPEVYSSPALQRRLDVLARERCSPPAIRDFAQAIAEAGYRREAAGAYLGYSRMCGGDSAALRSAVNILLDIPDNAAAADAATQLIAREPLADNGYFLRATAFDRLGEPNKAIDDFISAIELFADKTKIASASFVGLARNQDRLGRSCEAARSIERWIALNPARNDSARSRAAQAAYAAKGGCPATIASREESFQPARGETALRVVVAVNDVRGTFLVDRDASYVVVTRAFAERAKVAPDSEGSVRVRVGAAAIEGRRARAQRIVLRSLQASDVPVIAHLDDRDGEGAGIDGRLGASFLSRFAVVERDRSLRLGPQRRAAR